VVLNELIGIKRTGTQSDRIHIFIYSMPRILYLGIDRVKKRQTVTGAELMVTDDDDHWWIRKNGKGSRERNVLKYKLDNNVI